MSDLILPPSVLAKPAKHRCMCGAEFEPYENRDFLAHIKVCADEAREAMLKAHEKTMADGFQTGFDKEKIKYHRDRGHL